MDTPRPGRGEIIAPSVQREINKKRGETPPGAESSVRLDLQDDPEVQKVLADYKAQQAAAGKKDAAEIARIRAEMGIGGDDILESPNTAPVFAETGGYDSANAQETVRNVRAGGTAAEVPPGVIAEGPTKMSDVSFIRREREAQSSGGAPTQYEDHSQENPTLHGFNTLNAKGDDWKALRKLRGETTLRDRLSDLPLIGRLFKQ